MIPNATVFIPAGARAPATPNRDRGRGRGRGKKTICPHCSSTVCGHLAEDADHPKPGPVRDSFERRLNPIDGPCVPDHVHSTATCLTIVQCLRPGRRACDNCRQDGYCCAVHTLARLRKRRLTVANLVTNSRARNNGAGCAVVNAFCPLLRRLRNNLDLVRGPSDLGRALVRDSDDERLVCDIIKEVLRPEHQCVAPLRNSIPGL